MSTPKTPKRIGVLLFPDYEMLDVFGPMEMFGMANKCSTEKLYEIVYIGYKPQVKECDLEGIVESEDSSKKKENLSKTHEVLNSDLPQKSMTILTRDGPVISTQHTIKNHPDIHVLFVPGGWGTRALIESCNGNNKDLFQWIYDITTSNNHNTQVFSVCTGSGLLAKAGILDNINATSNKRSLEDEMMPLRPQVKWQKNARWCRDVRCLSLNIWTSSGRSMVDQVIWTSSGVSAGMDMVLAFIAEDHGEPFAESVAHRAEYVWNKNSQNDPFNRLFCTKEK